MKQNKRDNIDTAMLMLAGFGSGALLAAMFLFFMGVFIDAGDDEIWSLQAALSGIISIGISVVVGIVIFLYWKFIASKTGVLFPELRGFTLLVVFASVISGMAFTVGLMYQFIM